MNYNCSNFLEVINLRYKLKKNSVTRNCSDLSLFEQIVVDSDLNFFANSQPSALNFKSFSQSLGQFFLTVGQNNFGNKIPFIIRKMNLLATMIFDVVEAKNWESTYV